MFQKKKWSWQKEQRNLNLDEISSKRMRISHKTNTVNRGTLNDFFRRTQFTLLDRAWDILQVIITCVKRIAN